MPLQGGGKSMCLYVRSLTIAEGQRIQRILRRGTNRTVIRRAQVFLMSDQGSRVQEIAQMTLLSEEYIRELIRRFNSGQSKELLEAPRHPGRPRIFSEEMKAEIAEVAMAPPSLLQQPFTRWSLQKLSSYLKKTRQVPQLSLESLRQILAEKGVRLRRTKTWKESNDPAFERKKKGSRGSTTGARRRATS